jgi:hypothetical protein
MPTGTVGETPAGATETVALPKRERDDTIFFFLIM